MTQTDGDVAAAEQRLRVQLNYGGIIRDPESGKLSMNFRHGDLPDEIGQMRRLASAFDSLADALEDKGVACKDRLPGADDADEKGFVEWLRSGQWLRGGWEEQPVDATRWRCMSVRI